MNGTLWLAAGLACAQLGGEKEEPRTLAGRPTTSRIVSATIFRGQARVTREVDVPEGDGPVELIVGPLPPGFVAGSLFAEGSDGLRVAASRVAHRRPGAESSKESREREQESRRLAAEAERLRKEADVQEQDLQYLKRLEGFTGSSLTNLTEKGRLDSEAVVALSRFLMETRAARVQAGIEVQERLQANAEAVSLAQLRQLREDEASAGPERGVREAVLLVQRSRPGAGVVRIGYLASGADWTPRYRLRGGGDKDLVTLECLASLTQRTGEDWSGVAVGLSTADPSLDASPPELLPLKLRMASGGEAVGRGDPEPGDDASRKILAELRKPLDMNFPNETPLGDVLKYIRAATSGPAFPNGLPVYVDPIGLNEADKDVTSPIAIDLTAVPLATSLPLALSQLGLGYRVRGGVLQITSVESIDADNAPDRGEDDEQGMAGIAGMGRPAGPDLNRVAAGEQAEELRVAEGAAAVWTAEASVKGVPGASFAVPGRIDVPSRPGPQTLDVARVDLPADYFAKAVPVLTPRIYRLAKLTNAAAFAILPGDADVFIGGEFVGRMRLPLVAAGEPFVAGFGVDPQVQVGRRLVRKSRVVQGGNQVLAYEFRVGLRNFHAEPIKVQLWDRLPRPEGETAAVNLMKTSVDLSTDALYLRTARMDNLLRWDLELAPGTVGEKTLYVDYEFRLEYARDLPPPRFDSGGLKENPIGGGAMGMGGMGGMGGGFRSVGRRGFE